VSTLCGGLSEIHSLRIAGLATARAGTVWLRPHSGMPSRGDVVKKYGTGEAGRRAGVARARFSLLFLGAAPGVGQQVSA